MEEALPIVVRSAGLAVDHGSADTHEVGLETRTQVWRHIDDANVVTAQLTIAACAAISASRKNCCTRPISSTLFNITSPIIMRFLDNLVPTLTPEQKRRDVKKWRGRYEVTVSSSSADC